MRRERRVDEFNRSLKRMANADDYDKRWYADSFLQKWGSGQSVVFSHGWPLSADGLDQMFGKTAMTVIVRLSPFLLLCIRVQTTGTELARCFWLSAPRRR